MDVKIIRLLSEYADREEAINHLMAISCLSHEDVVNAIDELMKTSGMSFMGTTGVLYSRWARGEHNSDGR